MQNTEPAGRQIAEAQLGKDIVKSRIGNLTSEQEIISRMRELQQSSNIEATNDLRTRIPKTPDAQTINNVLNENFGTTKKGGAGPDANDKDYTLDASSAKFRREAGVNTDANLEYVNKGYDNLTRDQKDLIYDQVLVILRSRGSYAAQIDALGPDARKIVEERVINDPDLRAKFAEGLASGFSPDKILGGVEDILRVQNEVDTLTKKLSAVESKTGHITTELTAAESQLKGFNEFTEKDAAGVEQPTKAARLLDLQTQVPGLKLEQAANDATIQRLSAEISGLRPTESAVSTNRITGSTKFVENPSVKRDIDVRQKEIDRLVRRNEEIRSNVVEHDTLAAQQRDLAEKVTNLSAQKEAAEKEQIDLDSNLQSSKDKLGILKAHRITQEQQFLDSINEIAGNATEQFIEGQLDSWEESRRQALIDQSAKEQNSFEAEIDKIAAEVGLIEDPKKKGHWKRDKDVCKKNGTVLLRQGLDQYIVNIVASGSEARQAEIEKLMSDPAKRDDLRAKFGPVVMGRFLNSGGKLTKGDIDYLKATDWGPNLIRDALTSDGGINSAVESALANGVLDQDFLDKIKRFSGDHWLSILMLLLGGGVALVGAPAAAVALGGLVKAGAGVAATGLT